MRKHTFAGGYKSLRERDGASLYRRRLGCASAELSERRFHHELVAPRQSDVKILEVEKHERLS
jgi:hypothetical protein